ncbi:M15 family metallopeptidase [Actinotalea fermentans]|uniref:Peptidase M15C domain-containing protein n=1 Tax=Actinotalea fermentans TaxID=43671 RepID=A0A511YTJ3_9CELL|nr:M15 family metallopeptidase [Actinotalea fermentans]KGM15027.1 hypothetical protein N867_12715 [Actinotalea fermentans ATCC 43279 = JCM 9966 = DSM 3133]GEN78517.1 hypothetical protein AFE02nite_02510 [Actinotalea fermentans]
MATATKPAPRPPAAPARRLGYPLALAALAVVVVLAWGVFRGGTDEGPDEVPDGATQNGWEGITDSDDPRLVSFPWVTGQVLDGDVAVVLGHVAERFNAEVEPIDVASSWGWAYRPVRGHDEGLSNHASGTAVDFNAPLHPLGSSGTFTDDQVARLRAILDEVAPVLAWGGDFDRPDEMHLEIVGTPDEVAEVAARLSGA